MMMWNYLRFDFGTMLFPGRNRYRLGAGQNAGIDLARFMDDATGLSDFHPTGCTKSGK